MREINDNTLVEVWNNHNSSISYSTDRVVRIWHAADSSKKIKLEELHEACNAPGGREFFEQGALLIRDNEVRAALDLPQLDEFILDRTEMKELLNKSDAEEIEKFLQYCSNMLLDTFVQVAIEMPVKDMIIAKLIGKYSSLDLISIIKENQEDVKEVTADSNKVIDKTGRAKRVVKE